MRTAVVSDIHANLEAFEAVLGRITELAVDRTLCLGDIVGYNANPNECLDLIRGKKIASIIGNHDACASGLEEPDDFNLLAKQAVLWTRRVLTETNKAFLMDLPRERQVSNFLMFHGSVHDTDRYILAKQDAVENFRLLAGLPGSVRLGFFAHTHIPAAFSEYRGSIARELSSELSFAPDIKYLINPGSVGQPRDSDPRAAFLVYDEEAAKVFFYRVEYDIQKSQNKIIRAGLPPRLAERLEWGR